jgi:hypothetical protein
VTSRQHPYLRILLRLLWRALLGRLLLDVRVPVPGCSIWHEAIISRMVRQAAIAEAVRMEANDAEAR